MDKEGNKKFRILNRKIQRISEIIRERFACGFNNTANGSEIS